MVRDGVMGVKARMLIGYFWGEEAYAILGIYSLDGLHIKLLGTVVSPLRKGGFLSLWKFRCN
ncbi:hypothetical protein DXZ20_27240 [Leptolyngbyaceae cyanobacterium CCMR0081]|uniref:Uncharacterized protein n=1 Tax=Adonisia turfae CCMR0081 TaxID=2292702 RepID=A0A6M0RU24_9CYAN|nr:hypothetical protein [Adonisia turfae CCMR0081]